MATHPLLISSHDDADPGTSGQLCQCDRGCAASRSSPRSLCDMTANGVSKLSFLAPSLQLSFLHGLAASDSGFFLHESWRVKSKHCVISTFHIKSFFPPVLRAESGMLQQNHPCHSTEGWTEVITNPRYAKINLFPLSLTHARSRTHTHYTL